MTAARIRAQFPTSDGFGDQLKGCCRPPFVWASYTLRKGNARSESLTKGSFSDDSDSTLGSFRVRLDLGLRVSHHSQPRREATRPRSSKKERTIIFPLKGTSTECGSCYAFGCMVATRGGYRMARGWHYAKLSLSNARRLSFSGMCILLFLFLSLCRFCLFVFFFCSHWSLVDVPLISFCPADHVPDWQPRMVLGMVESRSVKAVVKYVGGFWPIGVFFAGYRSFFFAPSRQTQTKARL